MMSISNNQPYSIYQSALGIELAKKNYINDENDLICLCSHYKSALRIATQVSMLRQLPLIINNVDIKPVNCSLN